MHSLNYELHLLRTKQLHKISGLKINFQISKIKKNTSLKVKNPLKFSFVCL